jgi:basic amino acid/polyamine antiporter, APA family
MLGWPLDTWIRFVGRLAIALVIYALYGTKHSRFAQPRARQTWIF